MEQNNSGTEKNRILVMSKSIRSEEGSAYGIPPDPYDRNNYCYTEFHLADLTTAEIHIRYAPSLLQYVPPNSLVSVDKFVYIFGGPSPASVEPSHLPLFEPPQSHQEIFIGASRLLLDSDPSQGDGWCPVPKPIVNCDFPRCYSLSGKIYTFGSAKFAPEVFDPSDDPCEWEWKWKWDDYPLELVACQVSYYAVPDPSENRILVRFTGGDLPSPSIYSFSPIRGWELIARDFWDWTPVAAVVDNVIFFNSREFRGVLRAFDIQSKKWLKVRWASKFDEKINMNKRRMDFEALLPMGDRMLCLAGWSPTYDFHNPTTHISFLKFLVERIDSTINLHPDTSHSHSYVLPTSTVFKFLPV